MSHGSVMAAVAAVPLVNVVVAGRSFFLADKVARSNRELIDGGGETYFEQRRSWKAYGTTPSTDAVHIRRAALRMMVISVALLAILGALEIMR